jgi:hypothetical protein
MTTKFGSMMKVGALVAGLALVGTACGGDDSGGGVDRDLAREELTKLIGEDGMPEETVNCLVDAALDTFSDADLQSVIDGGDPSQEAEDAFTEKAMECMGG